MSSEPSHNPTPLGSGPKAAESESALRPSAGLGSLAQSARRSSLRSARGILLAIGIISIVLNVAVLATSRTQVREQVQKEIDALQRQGKIIDRSKLPEIEDRATRAAQLVAGGFTGVSVVFVLCGIFVHAFPVAATSLSLILYLGVAAITLYFNPVVALPGLLVKVFIIVALIKSLQAGIAYKRERAAELPAAFAAPA